MQAKEKGKKAKPDTKPDVVASEERVAVSKEVAKAEAGKKKKAAKKEDAVAPKSNDQPPSPGKTASKTAENTQSKKEKKVEKASPKSQKTEPTKNTLQKSPKSKSAKIPDTKPSEEAVTTSVPLPAPVPAGGKCYCLDIARKAHSRGHGY